MTEPRRLAGFATARVLVIDDDPANLALLATVLRRAGLSEVRTESDPRTVRQLLPEFDPQLVLLDLHMPQLSGYEVLEQIRQHAGPRRLPVLMLTGDVANDAVVRGAAGAITKPYDLADLIDRVAALLS